MSDHKNDKNNKDDKGHQQTAGDKTKQSQPRQDQSKPASAPKK